MKIEITFLILLFIALIFVLLVRGNSTNKVYIYTIFPITTVILSCFIIGITIYLFINNDSSNFSTTPYIKHSTTPYIKHSTTPKCIPKCAENTSCGQINNCGTKCYTTLDNDYGNSWVLAPLQIVNPNYDLITNSYNITNKTGVLKQDPSDVLGGIYLEYNFNIDGSISVNPVSKPGYKNMLSYGTPGSKPIQKTTLIIEDNGYTTSDTEYRLISLNCAS